MRRAITTLCVVAAALLAFGLVLVDTASVQGGAAAFSFSIWKYQVAFSSTLVKQLVAAGVGIALGLVAARVHYGFWRKRWIMAALALVSVAACLLVFLRPPVNGSRRWIMVGGFSLQPSEFSRVVMVMALALWYDHIGPRAREFVRGVLIPGAILAFFTAPVFLSPDVGATAVMCVAGGTVMVAAGVRWRWIILGGLCGVALLALMLAANPNKRARLQHFFDSRRGIKTESAVAYQSEQSTEAFVRGGLTGSGLGKGIQKHNYLPEANSDFIYAIAAEEFGIAATLSMVLAFVVLLWCGVFIAYHARDRFGRFLALGLTILLAFEAAFNIGMVTGCLPPKGIALPFASAGGSSLMATLAAVGLLVAVGTTSADAEAAPLMRNAQIEF